MEHSETRLGDGARDARCARAARGRRVRRCHRRSRRPHARDPGCERAGWTRRRDRSRSAGRRGNAAAPRRLRCARGRRARRIRRRRRDRARARPRARRRPGRGPRRQLAAAAERRRAAFRSAPRVRSTCAWIRARARRWPSCSSASTSAELADIIYEFGEERRSRPIARSIVRARDDDELKTTADLRRAVLRASGPRRRGGIDPATRTFQALRIAVNRELDELQALLDAIPGAARGRSGRRRDLVSLARGPPGQARVPRRRAAAAADQASAATFGTGASRKPAFAQRQAARGAARGARARPRGVSHESALSRTLAGGGDRGGGVVHRAPHVALRDGAARLRRRRGAARATQAARVAALAHARGRDA